MQVHILMATYNGEKYLDEQLQSIAKQTMSNWMLHICDDCSSDKTISIIEHFSRKHTGQVTLLKNAKNLGAKQTFARLVREVRLPGDYAFCDQDDIWREDKLEKLQQRLRNEERDKKEPILVYSDASLIDKNQNILAASFIKDSGLLLPKHHVFESLLLYNMIQGAAMLWNQSLHQIITDIPKQALMHDWWVALTAAGHGRIVCVPEPFSFYRQHDNNVIGNFDRKKWHRSLLKKMSIQNWQTLIQHNHKLQIERNKQAAEYVNRFGDSRAQEYLILMQKNRFLRTYLAIRKKYLFLSWKYSLKYYLL